MITTVKRNPLEILEAYQERVNSYLENYLNSISPDSPYQSELNNIMKYSVLACGKRFRPILTYTVANLYGIDIRKVDTSACAIELIHIYSLIHDDLPAMDDDDIRHKQPSCHKVYGEAQAILAGDGLQALAFEIISNDDLIDSDTKVKLLSLLSFAAFQMVEGQSIDLSIVSKKVDIELLNNLHKKKTGSLLNCSVMCGAILNPYISKKDLSILDSFSNHIGLAYQVQDDVFDVTTPDEILGKRRNSDSINNKPSYPSILGLDKSVKKYKSLYLEALDKISFLSVDEKPLKDLTVKLMKRSF